MEVSDKEMRKMLNEIWNRGHDCTYFDCKKERQSRRRDVTKILEAKKKEEKKDG